MADFDLAVIGGGASAHAFLLGLPEESKRRVILIAPMSDAAGGREPAQKQQKLASPKLNNPELKQSSKDWNRHFPGQLEVSGDFRYMGFGNGGGTRFWGNSVGIFDHADLVAARLDPGRMSLAYAELGRHIPIWGNVADIHSSRYQDLPRSEASFRSDRIARIDGVYRSGKLRVGASRNAVKSRGDSACIGCAQCINGCPIGALWQSDVAAVAGRRADTTLCDDWVRSIEPLSQGYQLNLHSSATVSARQIVLAVDPVACFALLAPLAGAAPSSALAYNPVVAWLALSARRQGAKDLFGLAHSQAIYAEAGRTLAFGHIFDGSPMTLSTTPVFSGNGVIEGLFRAALPNALLGNMFFRSPENKPRLTFAKSKVAIEASATEKPAQSAEVLASIREMMLRNGVIVIASKFSQPGSDLHFAGGTPDQLQSATAHHTQLPGVFVIGGAAMESLPPQSPTFTFMAAAFDLARHWQ